MNLCNLATELRFLSKKYCEDTLTFSKTVLVGFKYIKAYQWFSQCYTDIQGSNEFTKNVSEERVTDITNMYIKIH